MTIFGGKNFSAIRQSGGLLSPLTTNPVWALLVKTQLVSRWFLKLFHFRSNSPKFDASITKMHDLAVRNPTIMECLEADGLGDQNVQIKKKYFFQGYVEDVVFT